MDWTAQPATAPAAVPVMAAGPAVDPVTAAADAAVAAAAAAEELREAKRARKREQERARTAAKRAAAAAAAAADPTGAAATANSSKKKKAAAPAKPPKPSHAAQEARPAAEPPAAKRVRRAQPSTVAGSVAAAEAFDAAAPHGAAEPTHEPSPSVWSILADLVWLPRFLSVVHAQVSAGSRGSAALNSHVLASAWRQKLVEGGWAKDQHYLVKGELPEDGQQHQPGSVHLVKSRRSVADFTPSVCQQLWRLVAYHRDPSPQAALAMKDAATKHQVLEERCRQLGVPLLSGGRLTPLPQGATLKLERLYGLPPGGPQVADRKHAAAAASAPASAALEDDGSDVEDAFEYFPGVWDGNPLHSQRFRLDGATIDRWAKGWNVHVPPPPISGPCRPQPVGLAPTAAPSPYTSTVRNILSDPSHPQHGPVASLSSRPQLTGLLSDLQRNYRQHVGRNHMLLDMGTREWASTASLAAGQSGHVHPTWVSPNDDENLLESIVDWLIRQPPPTRATFGDAEPQPAALLPQGTSDWVAIRHACSAHNFSLGFLRRRMWLLCQETNAFDAAQMRAAEEAAAASQTAAGQAVPVVVAASSNPSLERLAARVGNITQMLTERIAGYVSRHAQQQQQQAPHSQQQQQPQPQAQPQQQPQALPQQPQPEPQAQLQPQPEALQQMQQPQAEQPLQPEQIPAEPTVVKAEEQPLAAPAQEPEPVVVKAEPQDAPVPMEADAAMASAAPL